MAVIAEFLEQHGYAAVLAMVVAGALMVWLRRRRRQLAGITRITPAELHAHIESGEPLTIVDLRARILAERSGFRLPGALLMHPADAEQHLRSTPRGHHLVFYCT
jgi:hypothetical protein